MPEFAGGFYKNGARVASISKVLFVPFPAHIKAESSCDMRPRFVFRLEGDWIPSRGDRSSSYEADTSGGRVAVFVERVNRVDRDAMLTVLIEPL